MNGKDTNTLLLLTMFPVGTVAFLTGSSKTTVYKKARKFRDHGYIYKPGSHGGVYEFTDEGKAELNASLSQLLDFEDELRWPIPKAAIEGDWLDLIEPDFFEAIPTQHAALAQLDENFAKTFMKLLVVLDKAIMDGAVLAEIRAERTDRDLLNDN
jgi:hypothetical protein